MGSSRSFFLLAFLIIGAVIGGQAMLNRVPLDKILLKVQSASSSSERIMAGSEDSMIPLERFGGVWVAYVELNDLHQAKLVVDTGATFTTISEDLAFNAGILPDPRTPSINLHTAGGIVQAQMGIAPRIRIGNAGRDNVRVVIHTLPNFPEEIDGLLGLSFFDGFLVQLDHAQGQLHLIPKD